MMIRMLHQNNKSTINPHWNKMKITMMMINLSLSNHQTMIKRIRNYKIMNYKKNHIILQLKYIKKEEEKGKV